MKKLIIILLFTPSMLLNAQVIDWNNFNEKTMNEVMFGKIYDYTSIKTGYSLISSGKLPEIYRCIKKNNEKLPVDSLSAKINVKILAKPKYNSPKGFPVGILDSISGIDIKTFQELADKCITDWKNSPSDAFFMMGWGKIVGVTSYYNIKTKTIYISVVFKS